MPSPQHEPVQPTPFEPARAQAQAPAPRGRFPWLATVALLVLLTLAALVLFWLPDQVARDAGPQTAEESSGKSTTATAAPHDSDSGADPVAGRTPWSEAQQARLRQEAQAVLEALLDAQFRLEERGVAQWAAEPWATAREIAATADEHYRERNFPAATAGYRRALEALQQIEDSIPARLQKLLQRADEAIEAVAADAAADALDTAALLAPDSAELAVLRQRSQLLPQLAPLLEQAASLEQSGDLADAQQRLQVAAGLDPQHRRVAAELVRVGAMVQERDFNRAMSEGYAALDAAQFSLARKAFRRAAALRPDSAEAQGALREVAGAATAAQLDTLRRQGRQYEDRERWSDAIAAYRQALATDATLLFASEGLRRALPRAELDRGLRAVLDEPQRLADAGVARDAAALLQRAEAVSPAGPQLQQQIDTLRELLQRANTPVSVTLHSDDNTRVTLYRVGQLGRFEDRQLSLRPGRYTALGTRKGYRDVRVEFAVTHDAAPVAVTVICTESI